MIGPVVSAVILWRSARSGVDFKVGQAGGVIDLDGDGAVDEFVRLCFAIRGPTAHAKVEFLTQVHFFVRAFSVVYDALNLETELGHACCVNVLFVTVIILDRFCRN